MDESLVMGCALAAVLGAVLVCLPGLVRMRRRASRGLGVAGLFLLVAGALGLVGCLGQPRSGSGGPKEPVDRQPVRARFTCYHRTFVKAGEYYPAVRQDLVDKFRRTGALVQETARKVEKAISEGVDSLPGCGR
jgi:hypothetical protein